MTKLIDFLRVAQGMRGFSVPKVWNEQYREALSERYIRISFGGTLELTDAGRAALQEAGHD